MDQIIHNVTKALVEFEELGRQQEAMVAKLKSSATPAQLASVEKANRMGWYINHKQGSDIVMHNSDNECEMFIAIDGKYTRN